VKTTRVESLRYGCSSLDSQNGFAFDRVEYDVNELFVGGIQNYETVVAGVHVEMNIGIGHIREERDWDRL
jgi:hypothetical protein